MFLETAVRLESPHQLSWMDMRLKGWQVVYAICEHCGKGHKEMWMPESTGPQSPLYVLRCSSLADMKHQNTSS